jgi:UDP-N-acetylmuramoyl-tripeptide--D-alanyl-D-alanine ligase
MDVNRAHSALHVGARGATFGSEPFHDARLIEFRSGPDGARVTAEIWGRTHVFPLKQSGFHWGLNSLAVILMLDALDVPVETALQALADFQPLKGRGETRTVHLPRGAFTLIDESYNANPLSMAAGFRSLGARPVAAGGRRVVVLTDMLELGDQSQALHVGLSEAIEAAGLDMVHTAGPQMKLLNDTLPASRKGLWRETASELLFDADAVDAERGVIVGEERTRDVPGLRAAKAQFGFLAPGQRLADRFPIGDLNIIRTAPREEFVDFYRKYYRPERATMIATIMHPTTYCDHFV